jgi:hypothetical protein
MGVCKVGAAPFIHTNFLTLVCPRAQDHLHIELAPFSPVPDVFSCERCASVVAFEVSADCIASGAIS